jgi:hypothetical protein
MRIKTGKGKFYLKKPELYFLKGKIHKISHLEGEMLVMENEGITYVVVSMNGKSRSFEGLMFPIVENYDDIIEIR